MEDQFGIVSWKINLELYHGRLINLELYHGRLIEGEWTHPWWSECWPVLWFLEIPPEPNPMEHEGKERERGWGEGKWREEDKLIITLSRQSFCCNLPWISWAHKVAGSSWGREGGRAVSGMKAVHCPLCLWPHFSSLPKGMCLQGKESGEKNKVTQLFLQQALHVHLLPSREQSYPRPPLCGGEHGRSSSCVLQACSASCMKGENMQTSMPTKFLRSEIGLFGRLAM